MKNNKINGFWAQAYDSNSKDYVEYKGKMIDAEDLDMRALVYSEQLKINVKERFRKAQAGVEVIIDKDRFNISVPTNELDEVGRVIPIECFGEYNEKDGDVLKFFKNDVLLGIKAFSYKINRKIDEDTFKEVLKKVEEVLDERSKSKIDKALLIVAATVTLFKIVSTKMKKSRNKKKDYRKE